MGTKNDPGKFDCYANAEPDEPMFILLGRDPCASFVVAFWAELRIALGQNPNDQQLIDAAESIPDLVGYALKLGKHQKIIAAFKACGEARK